MDLFPTLAAATGVALPPGHPVDGVSLLPALTDGADLARREGLYFHYRHPGHASAQRALVEDGWKYLVDRDGQAYLFHLATDPSEQTDLSERAPERLARMAQAHAAWLEDVTRGVAPMPPRTR